MVTLLPDHGVSFPISQPIFLLNNAWALLNTHSIGDFPSTLIASVPISAFFLASQMFVKITSCFFVRIDVLVDPFMTDACFFEFLHPQRDLLRTPVLPDLLLNPGPGLGLNTVPNPTASIHRFAVSLFWPISSLAAVPSRFPADG